MDLYRRDGTPYEGTREEQILAWGHDFKDMSIKIVKQDTLPNGLFISTVWLGLDHSWGSGPPLIFESMVFNNNFNELDMRRYSAENEALAGHCELVRKWRYPRAIREVFDFLARIRGRFHP